MPEILKSELQVSLRAVDAGDLVTLRCLRQNGAIQSLLMAHPEARTEDDTEHWIARRRDDPNGAFYAIDDAGECRGFVQLSNIHGIDRYADFGIALVPGVQGRGIGMKAMLQLIACAKARRLRKLCCHVRADNLRAVALYEQLGFRKVGTLNQHYREGEQIWDVVVMELLLEYQRQ